MLTLRESGGRRRRSTGRWAGGGGCCDCEPGEVGWVVGAGVRACPGR